MILEERDALKLYRGKPCEIANGIEIHVPTLDEICDYGELKYYSMVHALCSVGIDLCWQLEEMGIKFDEISDFQLFSTYLCRGYSNNQTKIILGDKLDFTQMALYVNNSDQSISLVQKCLVSVPLHEKPIKESRHIMQVPNKTIVTVLRRVDNFCKVLIDDITGYVMSMYISHDEYGNSLISNCEDKSLIGDGIYDIITIDEKIYHKLVGCLRSIHNLKRDDRVAGTRSCRMAFIEDAKMEYEAKSNEPKTSLLLPMISTMVNMEGFKRNDTDVWDMNIYAFMDSVKRISKIRNASLLLQSGYSGFGIDLKKIKKDEINYMGELD